MDKDRQVSELEFTVTKVVLKTEKFLEGTDKHRRKSVLPPLRLEENTCQSNKGLDHT